MAFCCLPLSPLKHYQWLILVICSVLGLMPHFVYALDEGSYLFDATVIEDSKLISGKTSGGVGLDAKRDQGLPWVFYYYVSKNSDAGESRFEAMPEGIGVNIMDTQIHFSNESMTKGDPTASMTKLQQFIDMRLDSSSAIYSLPDLSDYKRDELSYQSFLKTYPYEELLKGPAGINIRMISSENTNPVVLYAVSGQGEVPKTLQEIIKETNGSWYGRYRYIIWSFLVACLCLYAIYRYVSR